MQHAKTFDTIKQANNYQAKLHSKFDSVTLIKAPIFSEQGIYIWDVRK